jgi:anthranilate phosphoribosyltransferase
MKEILERLFQHQKLSKKEAKEILGNISEAKYHPTEVSAFLTVFRMRSITVEELSGFRDSMKEYAIALDLSEFNPVDLCGSGGDGKNTFNISTLASFVTAGAGVKVAKHGNYGVSSSCGSSNVMEYLGYGFTNDPNRLKKQIDKSGICFLHAPLFHPAMKNVAPIRRSMGVRTFFNMLGPMVNPSSPKNQMVGVYSLELQRYYKYIYEQEDMSYRIVHSMDGYDEISLTGPAKIVSSKEEYILEPEYFSKEKIKAEQLYGGNTVQESANIFLDILDGNGTAAQNLAVIANAALAIQAVHPRKSLEECKAMATESLESKRAQESLKTLLAI